MLPGVAGILIVDDDQTQLATLGAVLVSATEEEGGPHEVTVATSLAAARILLARASFDVVILDLHLPDGLGVALLPHLAGAMAFLLTGDADAPERNLRHPALVRVATKPINGEILLHWVQTAAARAAVRRATPPRRPAS